MDQPTGLDVRFVESVLHPTDFSRASEQAFVHALAIAVRRKTEFTILHASDREPTSDDWSEFPPVRATLERWGLLEHGEPRTAVSEKLAINVKKVNVRNRSPLSAVLDYLESTPMELIVLSTEGREGMPRWLRPSVAERLARRSRTLTLFVPEGARGFVSPETGRVTLRRIVLPVDRAPDPRPALVYTARIAALIDEPSKLAVTLFHAGPGGSSPSLELPASSRCAWTHREQEGDVAEEIIRAAGDGDADLIVMTTQGHHGILDALRGSVTEQVLRRAPCPVLAVPSHS